ncbi:MAG: hypothetical protein AMXMBFR34_29470 [Myxococcaceae bacterium]
MQVFPWQQPDGQLVASQMQAPPEHRWPAPHAALPPQRQTPLAQLSAFEVSQAAQVPPLVPQRFRVFTAQVLPKQQPVGQLVESHTQVPPRQRCPAAHCGLVPHRHWPPLQVSARPVTQAVQAPPVVPHAARSITRHWLDWQHPVGQLVESHTHAPETQRCPTAHAALLPHRHTPLAQESAFVVSQAVQAPPPVPQDVSTFT